MWFQNRRAKYRKQEKQLAKSLNPSVIPSCNGMMRNIYPTTTRGYPYPTHNTMAAGMNGMAARYPHRCNIQQLTTIPNYNHKL